MFCDQIKVMNSHAVRLLTAKAHHKRGRLEFYRTNFNICRLLSSINQNKRSMSIKLLDL